MSDPYIRDFCRKHNYNSKSDYGGIILRKRGWINVAPDYESVSCCGVDTDNNAVALTQITGLIGVLWIFYIFWMAATLTLWEAYGHGFLWVGCYCLTLNFCVIGCVVVKGYQADAIAYKFAVEKAKLAEESEGKSSTHQI